MSENRMNGAELVVNQAATEADVARKKRFRQDWEESGGGQLCLAFYDAFKKYKYYVETHGGEMLRPSGPISNTYDEHTVFKECLSTLESYKREREETLRRNLEKAQSAARCEHEFLTGERCRAPQSDWQAAVPDAREHGRGESGKAGPGPHGGPRQHSGGNQEIANSNYRWEAGLKADWASAIHDPASGVERNENEDSERGMIAVIARDRVIAVIGNSREARPRQRLTPSLAPSIV